MLGIVEHDRLERELQDADIAFVSQHYEGSEFNIPSKLMNFMAYGLPVLAAVNPSGEVARIVRESGAGWVVDSSDPDSFPREVARLNRAPGELHERASRARAYAAEHFTQAGFAVRFERTLATAVLGGGGRETAGSQRFLDQPSDPPQPTWAIAETWSKTQR
jgi:colanic acid biosynthesis glycosyl transferase WcaI